MSSNPHIFIFIFISQRPLQQHMEIPRPGTESELHLWSAVPQAPRGSFFFSFLLYLPSFSFLFFFFFFFFFFGIWKFLGQGSNQSCSLTCATATVTLDLSHVCDLRHNFGSTGSFTHRARLGLEPAASQRRRCVLNPLHHSGNANPHNSSRRLSFRM